MEQDGDFDSITEGFCKNTNIGDAASRVEGAHILLGGALAVRLADLGGEVRENAFLRDSWGADSLHPDAFHNRTSGLRRILSDDADKRDHQE